jgi:hypothetical protein
MFEKCIKHVSYNSLLFVNVTRLLRKCAREFRSVLSRFRVCLSLFDYVRKLYHFCVEHVTECVKHVRTLRLASPLSKSADHLRLAGKETLPQNL